MSSRERRRDAAWPTLAAAMVLGFAGCASPSDTPHHADARQDYSDGGAPSCNEATATLGRCELEGTGETCTGVPGEARVFVPLLDGDPLPAVIGPQAALMFVLSVRTTGIFPGDPENPASADNPTVDIALDDGLSAMAHYRGRPPFAEDETISGQYDAAGLFVVIERPGAAIDGVSINAVATIADKDGENRCAQVRFIAEY